MRLIGLLFVFFCLTSCASHRALRAPIIVVSEKCIGTLAGVEYELDPCQLVIELPDDSSKPTILFSLIRRQKIGSRPVTTHLRYQGNASEIMMRPVDPSQSLTSAVAFPTVCGGFEQLNLQRATEAVLYLNIWHNDNQTEMLILPLRIIVVPPRPLPVDSGQTT